MLQQKERLLITEGVEMNEEEKINKTTLMHS
jgi:hypothetical protein